MSNNADKKIIDLVTKMTENIKNYNEKSKNIQVKDIPDFEELNTIINNLKNNFEKFKSLISDINNNLDKFDYKELKIDNDIIKLLKDINDNNVKLTEFNTQLKTN